MTTITDHKDLTILDLAAEGTAKRAIPFVAAQLTIDGLAQELAAHEGARRQRIALIADLVDKLIAFRRFADAEYRRRLAVERRRVDGRRSPRRGRRPRGGAGTTVKQGEPTIG